jgi:hypothetical protein
MSIPAKCVAITKTITQCSRNALPNSIYCAQHLKIHQSIDTTPQKSINPQLIRDAIQPQLLNQIFLYSGNIQNISKNIKIPKEKLIQHWLLQIGVKRNLKVLRSRDYKLLWVLYQTRIDNTPNKDLLNKAISEGLNQSIFYSIEIQYRGEIESLGTDDSYLFDDNDLKIINSRLYDNIKKWDLQVGDTIRLMQFGDYRNSGVLLYDGSQLVDLNYDIDDYGSIPLSEAFNIINYPINTYFSNTIAHNNYVVMKSEDYKIQISETYNIIEGDELKNKLEQIAMHYAGGVIDLLGTRIYKYKVFIDPQVWIIYSPNNALDLKNMRYFDTSEELILDYEDFYPHLNDSVTKEKGNNLLFDTVIDDSEKLTLLVPKNKKKIISRRFARPKSPYREL